jgi:hypothetical protein
MKKIMALSVFMLVLFSATTLFAQEVQTQNKYQKQTQNNYQSKFQYNNFIDEDGDGICDLAFKNGAGNRNRETMHLKFGHKYGPGNGTGTGIGPKDGTGYGGGNGTGECDGTGPKGNRGGR